MDGKHSMLLNMRLYEVIEIKVQKQEPFKQYFNDVI